MLVMNLFYMLHITVINMLIIGRFAAGDLV